MFTHQYYLDGDFPLQGLGVAHRLHSDAIGYNSILWPHLTSGETEKGSPTMCPIRIRQWVLVDSQYSLLYVAYHTYFLHICKINLNIPEHHALACFFNLIFSHHCCFFFFFFVVVHLFVSHYLSGPGYSHRLTDIIFPIIESSLCVHGEWTCPPFPLFSRTKIWGCSSPLYEMI